MQLFDFINTFFKPAEFSKIKMHDKSKHFFMVQRFASIKYPLQASYFNHIKIHPGQVVSYWQESWSKLYTRTPGWMYVKTKKIKEEKKKELPVKEETIKAYCELHKMSKRDFQDSLDILGNAFITELINFEKLITHY